MARMLTQVPLPLLPGDAAEIAPGGLLPQLRQVVGDGRRVTVCFDRGGWSPALFADITGAGFDLLTYRKGPVADLPGSAFTKVTCTDDRGRAHEYQLADTIVALEIAEGPRKGQTVSLRQVTRREAASRGAIRQVHTLTSRADLLAGEVCWRMSSRWRESPTRPCMSFCPMSRVLGLQPGRGDPGQGGNGRPDR